MALSLQDIMNEMASQPEMLRPKGVEKAGHPMPKIISEMDAFVSLDPLLAQLNRSYEDAKSNRLSLSKAHGVNDPMVEIALEMEDSAWCMMQTRFLEVRADRGLMRQAQSLMRNSENLVEAVKEKKQKEKAIEVFQFYKMLQKMRELNKTPRIFEWLYILVLLDPIQTLNPKPHLQHKMAA